MLLVKPPAAGDLLKIVVNIRSGALGRDEVSSWQKAVFEKCEWEVPIPVADGYWYFYSLMYIATPYPDTEDPFFLRDRDLAEFEKDIRKEPGAVLAEDLIHLRSHQVELEAIRWPLAVIADKTDMMAVLPGVRGVFEKHQDMLEHCHLRFAGSDYLLVKQFDEMTASVMLLGNNRDRDLAARLMETLTVDE